MDQHAQLHDQLLVTVAMERCATMQTSVNSPLDCVKLHNIRYDPCFVLLVLKTKLSEYILPNSQGIALIQ